MQEILEFKAPGEERKCGRGPPSGNAICLIHDNLQSGTMYYFCVRANNASGESEMSDTVNCLTLSVNQSILPGNYHTLLATVKKSTTLYIITYIHI